MNDQHTGSRIPDGQGCAIDLLDPTIYRWKVKRRFTLITVAKILAAILVFPAMFFSVFLCLWALAALIGSLPIVVFTCVLLFAFIVALSKLAYDRWLGDESVLYQGAVLGSLSGILLFAAICLFAFLVADLRLIDGRSHSLYEWSFYFGNVLSYNALAQIAGDQAAISVNYWYSKVIVVALNSLFYASRTMPDSSLSHSFWQVAGWSKKSAVTICEPMATANPQAPGTYCIAFWA